MEEIAQLKYKVLRLGSIANYWIGMPFDIDHKKHVCRPSHKLLFVDLKVK